MLMGGLVDGETVVAVVVDVTIETNDVVVDTDVVEVLDSVVWADVAEEKDIFFLALSDYARQPPISIGSGQRKLL